MSTKIYLSVPFERKDDAKSLGAKWDKDKKHGILTLIIYNLLKNIH